jgi:hypothetical protein
MAWPIGRSLATLPLHAVALCALSACVALGSQGGSESPAASSSSAAPCEDLSDERDALIASEALEKEERKQALAWVRQNCTLGPDQFNIHGCSTWTCPHGTRDKYVRWANDEECPQGRKPAPGKRQRVEARMRRLGCKIEDTSGPREDPYAPPGPAARENPY